MTTTSTGQQTTPVRTSRPRARRGALTAQGPGPRRTHPAAYPTSRPRGRTAPRVGAPARTRTEASPTTLVVLIPAYQPDARLPRLITRMQGQCPGCAVLVVDDGSGPEYAEVFASARSRGAEVLTYAVNQGKGEALRRGLARAAVNWPQADVVCADADGQHTPSDIAAVAARVRSTGRMTLGVRRFTGPVPLRSRLGNDITALLFRGATGWALGDTQTGLRGYPAGGFGWLQEVPGDRYEYELSALLKAHDLGLAVEEVEIATVYEPGNTSSHFRPLRDSARIYAPLLAFTGASLASFAIDWLGVMIIFAMTGSLLTAAVGARIISGTANFFMNRRVFRAAPGTVVRTAVRYTTLALSLVAASYLALWALTGLGVPLGLAKIIGDGTIYIASYLIQRRMVFRERS